MEIKKSTEANLESKRFVFFFVGLVMVASMVLMAFQYQSATEFVAEIVEEEDDKLGDEMVFELPPEEEPPEEEPQNTPPPPQIEDPPIVDDDEEIDEADFSDLDDEQEFFDDDDGGEIEAEPIVDFAEVEPEFPGGESAMAEFIQNTVIYPSMSVEMGEQGTVYVNFVVNSNGSIEQVKVLRGVSDALDAEAIRIVKKMPKWKAGEQAGKKVRVRFTLPIKFNLG